MGACDARRSSSVCLGDSARVARVRVAQCRARKGGRESGVFRLERFFHHARCSAEDERDKNDDVPYKRKGKLSTGIELSWTSQLRSFFIPIPPAVISQNFSLATSEVPIARNSFHV